MVIFTDGSSHIAIPQDHALTKCSRLHLYAASALQTHGGVLLASCHGLGDLCHWIWPAMNVYGTANGVYTDPKHATHTEIGYLTAGFGIPIREGWRLSLADSCQDETSNPPHEAGTEDYEGIMDILSLHWWPGPEVFPITVSISVRGILLWRLRPEQFLPGLAMDTGGSSPVLYAVEF